MIEVAEHRDALIAIRSGEMAWPAVNAWRLELHRAFDAAFAATTLPERSDYAKANTFLIQARRRMVDDESRSL